jgi:PAS domain S-box-containing protein
MRADVRPRFFPDRFSETDTDDPVSRLTRENAMLREEIRVAREAAEITASLVVQQFEETEKILRRFQVANAQRKAVLNSATQVAIIAADTDGMIRVFNTGAENLLRYPATEVVDRLTLTDFPAKPGRCLRELAARSGRPFTALTEGLLAYAARDTGEQLEWELKRRDGTVFPVSMTVNALRKPDGLVSGVLCIAGDISERKSAEAALKNARDELEERVAQRTEELARANRELQTEIRERLQVERALRASEEKFRGIFENATEGIFQTTPEGAMITANPAMVRRLGYADESEVTRSLTRVREQLYVQPEKRDELLERLYRDGFVRNFETRYYRKDGSTIEVSLNVHMVGDGAGNPRYFEGIMTDITQRKRAEDLKIAKEAAEAATRTKSEFLANMSHEIRTPMNAIIGLAELALRTELSPRQSDYLEKIRTASHSLLGIINDILDFSKMEAGRMRLEAIPFRLDGVLDDLADVFAGKVAAKGLEMGVSAAEDVPRSLVGDPLRLAQVLMNLTSNALKFTESGQVLVAVSTERIDPEFALLRFAVRDSGIGISEAAMDRLFESFSQADSSTTRKYGGTGLGLSICRQLVQLMGGEITVESAPGEGTTFSFTARFRRPAGERIGPDPAANSLAGRTALLVDDNPAIRELYAEQLRALGLTVVSVDSGGAAFRELAGTPGRCPFDLALLDWRMPGLDGIAVLERIRHSRGISALPVVMMSAFGREGIRRRAEAAGASAFLIKPVKPSVLRGTLLELFGIADPDGAEDFSRSGAPGPEGVWIGREDEDLDRRIRGSRILLAEDNRINQQVIRELLQDGGVVVDMAENGKIALEALERTHYDAVLMDVQMPEMDGYTACRRIREDERFADLPVIAMTAYALEGDRERCLDAGMNDYVTKPVEMDLLFRVLGRWLPDPPGEGETDSPGQTGDPGQGGSAKAESMTPPGGWPGIDLPRALARIRKPALLHRLLRDFHRDFAEVPIQIKAAIRGGDREAASTAVHNLKGVAGNLSATGLFQAALELENALRHASDEDVPVLADTLESAFFEVWNGAGAVFAAEAAANLGGGKGGQGEEVAAPDGTRGGNQNSTGPGGIPAETGGLLAALMERLRAQDLAAEELAAELRELLSGTVHGAGAAELEARIGDLDFEGAREALRSLAEGLNFLVG